MHEEVDERIRTLILNGVKAGHRSMFVIHGDKSLDQIRILHDLMSKSVVKSKHNVLWCYKEPLDFSSDQEQGVNVLVQKGLLDSNRAYRFSLFLQSSTITYCSYIDSKRILGNTFGMCILQDFEALTPNLLARTIATVEGGGVILLLLRSISSLTGLYTMDLDVHARFRTESYPHVSGRFNKRLLDSLASCKACLVMDYGNNILPLQSHVNLIAPAPLIEDSKGLSESARELQNPNEVLNDDLFTGLLSCCTSDQRKALITFLDALRNRNIQITIALLASRGRGKSAALGLAIAGAVALGYSNIFVTAPSPENLKTLFEFVCKGLDMLKDCYDYTEVKSTNQDWRDATVQIKIERNKRVIQYIQPHEHAIRKQCQLMVIDEAAAIPLPVLKSLLGPYHVFFSSTVHGYEGILKLLHQLEEQSHASGSGQLFRKIELSESIRYASADPIESWLNSLLCLDATNSVPSVCLHDPEICDLYYVNKDTLFSLHMDSELFLQRMMALYLASHYENSPDDLQLMADAPAHHLFVLLGPGDESKEHLRDILCVIQICFEGQISKTTMTSLTGLPRAFGDQIPWKCYEQFQDKDFPSLSGARIVRIATHPDAIRRGYGSRAVKLLASYFEGKLAASNELPLEKVHTLLAPLHERIPEKLHYLGVSFGLTFDLFLFWKKHEFLPFYIGPKIEVTGERTCMVLRPLRVDGIDRLSIVRRYEVFRNDFTKSLNRASRQMEYKLAMSVLDPKLNFREVHSTVSSSNESLKSISELLPSSMGHLEAFANNRCDDLMIENIVDDLAKAYFSEKIPTTLSYDEASVLLCVGLQGKGITCIEGEMKLERQQILSLYREVMKKFYRYLSSISPKEAHSTVSRLKYVS